MIIQPGQFATNSLRQSSRGDDICQILAAAINSADPGGAIRNHVSLDDHQLIIDSKIYNLELNKRVFVIGAGKAVVPMAAAVLNILGDRVTAGFVITKKGHLSGADINQGVPVSIIEANHPIPDQLNLEASEKLLSLINHLNSDDLVLCLLSGGASALLMKPPAGISLHDLQVTTGLLLSCGADIGEINTIRKHLDEIKGGGLAKLVSPASLVSLILSDVVGDSLDSIASGPTVADPTTFQDAWKILIKYRLADQLPSSVVSHIQAGLVGKLPESLKLGNLILDHVQNIIVGNNTTALLAGQRTAISSGFTTKLLISSLQGEASQAGQSLSASAKSFFSSPIDIPRPACLIAGGETTVTIRGSGTGGRNQELALGAVNSLSGDQSLILISLATDGEDGPTDAAGAVATNQTYKAGLSLGHIPLEYLANNDSYHYFECLGDLIKTGPTLTNVNDLVFIFGL